MCGQNQEQDIVLSPVKVLEQIEVADKVYVLRIERKHDFIPGQIIMLDVDKGYNARAYSIASAIQDDYFDILYNVVEDGYLTPQLEKLKPGDKLYASNPFGQFIDDESPAWWIATGTGIGPFASMYRSGLQKGKKLLHGSRFLKCFYFADQFADMGSDYVRCCSREKGEGVVKGRLTFWLENEDELPKDQKYYLCGNAEMVVDVRDILIRKGIPFTNIVSEIYY